MTEPRMPAISLQGAREFLGLTIDAMARLLSVNPRTVRSWEAGRDPIPVRVREEVEAIQERTAEVVTEIAAGLDDSGDAYMASFRTDEDFARDQPELAAAGYTARWWRHVSERVALEVPGLVALSPDEYEGIIEQAVEAELRDQFGHE